MELHSTSIIEICYIMSFKLLCSISFHRVLEFVQKIDEL